MKKLLLLFTAVLLQVGAYAQDAVAVYRNNGKIEYFAFASKPKVTYQGDCLVMKLGDSVVQYSLRGLTKIAFGNAPTGMAGGPLSEGMTFRFEKNQISITNAVSGAAVKVYNGKGMMVRLLKTDNNGRQTVSLESLPSGAYMIQIGNTSYKVLKP